ncbi:MAG TPA: sel1 repeat family protein, partial [Alphaproteobacteria bacterium]|nr:sel1 repeat family protein [Alphaproteobacteria bacterium]
MKLKTSTALATLLLFLPCAGQAAELAIFPDLETAKQAYRAEDYTTAARNWMPLAHEGIPEAQVELGKLYSKGL